MEFENIAYETEDNWECYRKSSILVYFLVVCSTDAIFSMEIM